MTVGTLAGIGAINANGGWGDGGNGGGGAGGRIAIIYSKNTFSGTIAAQGGRGWNSYWAAAGTIYTATSGQTGLVTVDNGSNGSSSLTRLTARTLPMLTDVTLQNGARSSIQTGTPINNLIVASAATSSPGRIRQPCNWPCQAT